uniref:Uncharacterized protein n=1 Tax=Meloidogyne enterolobii TaxID=390850 RepID=A0A6V7VLR8_MELEN|nr:unnamed protein product [Meloidogyne enterolobii]
MREQVDRANMNNGTIQEKVQDCNNPRNLFAFIQLEAQIRPMLEKVGGSAPYADRIRPLKNTENLQRCENVGQQYNNLSHVYTELSDQFNKIDNDCEKYLIHERQNVLMADMKKILAYVRQHYNDYIAMQNAGTRGHGQHGQGQQGQSHRGQGRHGGGRRGGHREFGPGN